MFPDLTCDDVFRLETSRLWLRWPRAEDISSFLALNEPHSDGVRHVMDITTALTCPHGSDEAERLVFNARQSNALGRTMLMTITSKGKKRDAIGMIGINLDGELGCWFGSDIKDTSLVCEAISSILEAVFSYTSVTQVAALSKLEQTFARAIFNRCGFKSEDDDFKETGLKESGSRDELPPKRYVYGRSHWMAYQRKAHLPDHALLVH